MLAPLRHIDSSTPYPNVLAPPSCENAKSSRMHLSPVTLLCLRSLCSCCPTLSSPVVVQRCPLRLLIEAATSSFHQAWHDWTPLAPALHAPNPQADGFIPHLPGTPASESKFAARPPARDEHMGTHPFAALGPRSPALFVRLDETSARQRRPAIGSVEPRGERGSRCCWGPISRPPHAGFFLRAHPRWN